MTNYVCFFLKKKKLTNYLHFYDKIVFNFKCIYMYACVAYYFLKIIWLIIYILILKIVFKF